MDTQSKNKLHPTLHKQFSREETLISLTIDIASAMSGEELLAGLYFNDVQGS